MSNLHSFYRLFPLAMLALAAAAAPMLAAAPRIAAVAQVGEPATPGTRYVFLYLQYFDGATPHPAYAVYHKTGVANAPGAYQRLAVIRPTSHVPTLSALMQRASEAGFDNLTLELLLNDLLPPGPYTTLPEKVAAFYESDLPGGFSEQQKVMMVSAHPQMALGLGRAYLARVPEDAPNSFEIRVHDPVTEEEGPVIARVTSPATPAFLPPPAGLSEMVETTPRGHLRVHLRWCLPQPLREMGLHWSGFQVFRVPRQQWETAFGEEPPLDLTTTALLDAMVQDPGLAIPVNRLPISPGFELPCPPPAGSDLFFMTDDNDSATQAAFAVGGESFNDGFQATYYVAALDHFGRVGALSPGLPVTICDRLPPLSPSRVRVDNIYKQEGAADHALRISWHRDEAAEVRRYHLFRYDEPDDVFTDRQSPLWPATASRIAVVDNTGEGTRLAFTDTTAGAPTLPADDGRTRWFVLVAEDNTACPNPEGYGNLSGPSGAVPGALYDLAGPGEPQGRVRVPCCEIEVTQSPPGATNREDPLRLVARREHPQITWVEFRELLSGTFFGRFLFAGQSERIARPQFTGAAVFQARFGSMRGMETDWIGDQTMAGGLYPEHRWTSRWDCAPSFGCPGGIIDPVDPETGVLTGVCVGLINPPSDVVEAALYRRIGDNGPLVLMSRQKLDADGDGVQEVTEICEAAPSSVPGRSCYFLQYFDRNGNPSVLTQIDCVQSYGTEGYPTPRITAFRPESLEPQIDPLEDVFLAWFSPRPGVDRFEVAITPPPPMASETFQEGNEAGVGDVWGVFDSGRLANGFLDGSPNFAVSTLLERGKNYRARVRAVGEGIYGDRDGGEWSEVATIKWLYGVDAHGEPPPEDCPVPWPARAVAPLITDAARTLEARLVNWSDFIPNQGERYVTELWIKVGCFERGQVISSSMPGTAGILPPRIEGDDLASNLLVPLPFSVYIHQTTATSRGTMLQVSHYVDEILTASPQEGELQIIDRAFAVANFQETDPIPPPCLWFRVRQPLIAGRSYRCAVILHGGDREPIEVVRTIEITVPSLP